MSEKRKAKKEAKKAKKLEKKAQKLEKKELKKAKRGKGKTEETAELENVSYIAEGFCGEDEFSEMYWHIDEDGTLFITGSGYMTDFIDDPHFTRPWGEYADSIKTVYIEAGVKYIGTFAFHGLYNLIGFGVDPGSKYLSAFDGVLFNKDMTELIRYPLAGESEYVVPDTVTEIDDYAFADCPNIVRIILNENVITIGHHVFADCTKLRYIDGALGIQIIPNNAFEGCLSLSEFETWVNVVSIKDHAFIDCPELTTIILGRNVRDLGEGITDLCPKFEGYVVDDENIYFKSENGILFNKNSSMLIKYPAIKSESSYIVPRKVRDIAERSFAGNDSLTSVVFPNDLKTIGRYAFVGCTALNVRDLPPKLLYTGEFIFS